MHQCSWTFFNESKFFCNLLGSYYQANDSLAIKFCLGVKKQFQYTALLAKIAKVQD